MPGPTHLAVGLLKKPHGVKGDALIFPLTDQPAAVFQPGRALVVLDRDGRPTGETLTVERSRAYHRAWLLHFTGLEDRPALEVMRERFLAIEIGEARPLEEGEFFLHELIGLAVVLKDGTPVGVVRRLYEAPQGWLLAVESPGGAERLVPFTAGVVRRVDRAARQVVITPPDGLLEL
jgi:16S rRNA processing protein RimM